jgi:hypothetical protein
MKQSIVRSFFRHIGDRMRGSCLKIERLPVEAACLWDPKDLILLQKCSGMYPSSLERTKESRSLRFGPYPTGVELRG